MKIISLLTSSSNTNNHQGTIEQNTPHTNPTDNQKFSWATTQCIIPSPKHFA